MEHLDHILLLCLVMILSSCNKLVEPDVYSELDPDIVSSSEKGLKQTLNAAYAVADNNAWDGHSILNISEMTTDVFWNTGGGENRILVQMDNFTWNPDLEWFNDLLWDKPYRAIRNANTVIDNIDEAGVSDDKKKLFTAEARFIRALSYYRLYTWFGPVPLRTSTKDELELPRASEEDMLSFIESEFKNIITDLPNKGSEEEYGRAHKSAARAYLTLFYLNTEQWQKSADMADIIINNDHFSLESDYPSMFRKSGKMNSEFIWANYSNLPDYGNQWINGSFPPGYKTNSRNGLVWSTSMANWATQYRMYDSFYNTFNENDARRKLIIDEYENRNGETVSLQGDDNYRALKYYDVNASANDHASDRPTIRYAEILLARAESLNELSGPNNETIQLINKIRNRANLNNISLSDFSSTQALRMHILKERGWEFYAERKRRLDLIRMNKYIEFAKNRGVSNASEYRRR